MKSPVAFTLLATAALVVAAPFKAVYVDVDRYINSTISSQLKGLNAKLGLNATLAVSKGHNSTEIDGAAPVVDYEVEELFYIPGISDMVFSGPLSPGVRIAVVSLKRALHNLGPSNTTERKGLSFTAINALFQAVSALKNQIALDLIFWDEFLSRNQVYISSDFRVPATSEFVEEYKDESTSLRRRDVFTPEHTSLNSTAGEDTAKLEHRIKLIVDVIFPRKCPFSKFLESTLYSTTNITDSENVTSRYPLARRSMEHFELTLHDLNVIHKRARRPDGNEIDPGFFEKWVGKTLGKPSDVLRPPFDIDSLPDWDWEKNYYKSVRKHNDKNYQDPAVRRRSSNSAEFESNDAETSDEAQVENEK